MKDTDVPQLFPVPFGNAAAVGDIEYPIPTAAQPGGRASLTEGFPPVTFVPVEAGGIPPWGKDGNGIMYWTSVWARWNQSGGPVKWNATHSSNIGGYPKGAIVASSTTDGVYWRCTVNDNTSNPDTGGAGWVPADNPAWILNAGYTPGIASTFAGNPNGSVAGTQGTATKTPAIVWDTTHSIFWVCTTTGSAASAVWTQFSPNPARAVYFGSSTTWSVPIAVNQIRGRVWGGGGGGGGTSFAADLGAGGGGGEYREGFFSVVPGQVLTITIGAGGAGGGNGIIGGDGGPGGYSSILGYVLANGGGGGQGSNGGGVATGYGHGGTAGGGGFFSADGCFGGFGYGYLTTGNGIAVPGAGGPSFGYGSQPLNIGAVTGGIAASAGQFPGVAGNGSGGPSQIGGGGHAGQIIIEY